MTSGMITAWQEKGFGVSDPEYPWCFKIKTRAVNAGADICQRLTWTIGGGKLKAGDLLASKPKKAYQLALVGEARLQARDGVGVQVSGDQHLFPKALGVFL